MNLPFYTHFFFSHYFIKNTVKMMMHHFNNIFHEFKFLKKVITTKTFNVDFHNNFIKSWIILLLLFSTFFILSDLFPYLLPYDNEPMFQDVFQSSEQI